MQTNNCSIASRLDACNSVTCGTTGYLTAEARPEHGRPNAVIVPQIRSHHAST